MNEQELETNADTLLDELYKKLTNASALPQAYQTLHELIVSAIVQHLG